MICGRRLLSLYFPGALRTTSREPTYSIPERRQTSLRLRSSKLSNSHQNILDGWRAQVRGKYVLFICWKSFTFWSLLFTDGFSFDLKKKKKLLKVTFSFSFALFAFASLSVCVYGIGWCDHFWERYLISSDNIVQLEQMIDFFL